MALSRRPNGNHNHSIRAVLALLSPALALLQIPFCQSIPVTYELAQGQMECAYAPIHELETITTSLFITSGEDLKVQTKLQGPIASLSISSSAEVLAAAMRVDKEVASGKKPDMPVNSVTTVDFENLYNDDEILHDDDWDDDDDRSIGNGPSADDDVMDDIMFQDYYYMDDDDEYQFMEDDAMDDIEISEVRKARAARDAMTEEERAAKTNKKKEERRKHLEEMKKKREKTKRRKAEEVRKKRQQKFDAKKRELMENAAGKPLENTYEIQDEGWYRYCILATHSTVSFRLLVFLDKALGLSCVCVFFS